jgi:hypothetical protein
MIPASINQAEREAEYAALAAAVEESRLAAGRGEVVSHEVVGVWLDAIARGENPPLPPIPSKGP